MIKLRIARRMEMLCILLFFLCSSVQYTVAQMISKTGVNKFEYEGKIYKFKELNTVFQNNDESLNLYAMSIRNQKKAVGYGCVAALFGGAGISLANQSQTCSGYFCGIGEGIGAAVSIALGTISGFAALVNLRNVTINREKAVQEFNRTQVNKTPPGTVGFHFIVGANGVGIAMKF